MYNEKHSEQLALQPNSLCEHVREKPRERVLIVSSKLSGFCEIPWESYSLFPISPFTKTSWHRKTIAIKEEGCCSSVLQICNLSSRLLGRYEYSDATAILRWLLLNESVGINIL